MANCKALLAGGQLSLSAVMADDLNARQTMAVSFALWEGKPLGLPLDEGLSTFVERMSAAVVLCRQSPSDSVLGAVATQNAGRIIVSVQNDGCIAYSCSRLVRVMMLMLLSRLSTYLCSRRLSCPARLSATREL